MAMDLNKLRTLVFEKSGIKVDTSDPIFALVALNEAVLSECVEPHVAVLDSAADKLKAQTAQLLEASEAYRSLLQQLGEVSDAGGSLPIARELAREQGAPDKLQSAIGAGWTRWHWAAAAGSVALLSAVMTVGGQWVIGPKSAPVRAAQANTAPTVPMLTPEQMVLMQNGEKYNRMWAKLDAKTQARIQALLQQP